MAFQKTINLPSGDSGNYVRIAAFRWDRGVKEASALFSLYKSAASAASGSEPQRPIVAKLRLRGADFDKYLGNPAIKSADVLAQLYAAAKVEKVVSDFGNTLFADAQDV